MWNAPAFTSRQKRLFAKLGFRVKSNGQVTPTPLGRDVVWFAMNTARRALTSDAPNARVMPSGFVTVTGPGSSKASAAADQPWQRPSQAGNVGEFACRSACVKAYP